MIKLTYKERQRVMTEFAKDPSLDVQVVKRANGSNITVTRSNQIVERR